MMNWSGLPKTITDYHRLPLTDWFYSIEHSKAISGWMAWLGLAWLGYIPDSTNHKSTASGANKKVGKAQTIFVQIFHSPPIHNWLKVVKISINCYGKYS